MSNATTDNQQQQISDTGNGFIQGVEPAQPRRAADWQPQGGPLGQQPQPQAQPPAGTDERPAYRWTDEDIARARQEEKDKLYGRIENIDQQMKDLQAQRDAEQAERDRLAGEAEAARREKEESEMDLRQLLERRDAESRAQIEALTQRYETDRAVFDREREMQATQEYMRQRLEQEAQYILPEMRQFVRGATPEEIDAAIEEVKVLTESVVQNFTAAQEPAPLPFQQRQGAAPTAPPVGPMEQLPNYQSLTPEDIRSMDMETYKRYRAQLLAASNPNFRG